MKKMITIAILTALTLLVSACGDSDAVAFKEVFCKMQKGDISPETMKQFQEVSVRLAKNHAGDAAYVTKLQATKCE